MNKLTKETKKDIARKHVSLICKDFCMNINNK